MPKSDFCLVWAVLKNSFFAHFIKYRRMIAAVCAGLAVSLCVKALAPRAPHESTVLVLAHQVAPGMKLLASDVTTRTLPDQAIWNGILTRPTEAVGRVTGHALEAGQPVSATDLIGRNLLNGLPAGTVAIEIPATQLANTSLVESGNHIDLYATANTNHSPSVLIGHNLVVVSSGSSNSATAGDLNGAVPFMLAASSSEAKQIASYLGNYQLSTVLLGN